MVILSPDDYASGLVKTLVRVIHASLSTRLLSYTIATARSTTSLDCDPRSMSARTMYYRLICTCSNAVNYNYDDMWTTSHRIEQRLFIAFITWAIARFSLKFNICKHSCKGGLVWSDTSEVFSHYVHENKLTQEKCN